MDNPFAFSLENINTIGDSTVLALSSATKPISEGQFGYNPMYAFTSNGIWALTPNSTGGWAPIQPVNRDVLIDPSSVTQIDDAVIFSGDRGLMLLSGRTSKCLSEPLGDDFFPLGNILNLTDVMSSMGVSEYYIQQPRFKEFINGAHYAFDYEKSRLLISNTSKKFSYVYSMKSGNWAIIPTSGETINAYPYAYFVKGNILY